MTVDLTDKHSVKQHITDIYNGKYPELYSSDWGKATHYGFARYPLDKMIENNRYESILDYGCGYSTALDNICIKFPNITVAKFDPYIAEYEAWPTGTYDLVICNQVLQWVAEENIDTVIEGLHTLTNRDLYLAVVTNPDRFSWQAESALLDRFSNFFNLSFKEINLNVTAINFANAPILKCLMTKK